MKNGGLSVALIGVGGYGQTHLQALAVLEREGSIALRWVVDPSPESLPDCHASLVAKGVRWCRTWEDLTADGTVPDCVVIAVPIPLHDEYARKAYLAGCYVYLEKPPVPLLSQLDQLIEMELGSQGRRIHVGFQFAFSEQMRVLGDWIRTGQLGEIVHYRLLALSPRTDAYYGRASWTGKISWRGLPVFDGPATNALAHGVQDMFTLENWRSGQIRLPELVCGEVYRAAAIDSYDLCSLTGRFPFGPTFSFVLGHCTRDQILPTLEIVGSKGTVKISGEGKKLSASFTDSIISSVESNLLASYRSFLRVAFEQKSPELGLREVRPFVAVTNAMFGSSAGINGIGREHCDHSILPSGNIVHVENLNALCFEAFQKRKNLSEIGAPWGRKGERVSFRTGFEKNLEDRMEESALTAAGGLGSTCGL